MMAARAATASRAASAISSGVRGRYGVSLLVSSAPTRGAVMMTFRIKRILPLLPIFFLLIGCGGAGGDEGGAGDPGSGTDLAAVNDFPYQLQGGDDGIDLEALGETAFDLLVIDYSPDRSDGGGFT